MTNPLTDERSELTAQLAELLGDGWNVYPSPPPDIVPPCAFVAYANRPAYADEGQGLWNYLLDVWVFAKGLDLEGLEDALAKVLAAHPEAVLQDPPGAARYASSTFLGATLSLPRRVLVPVTPTS